MGVWGLSILNVQYSVNIIYCHLFFSVITIVHYLCKSSTCCKLDSLFIIINRCGTRYLRFSKWLSDSNDNETKYNAAFSCRACKRSAPHLRTRRIRFTNCSGRKKRAQIFYRMLVFYLLSTMYIVKRQLEMLAICVAR